MPPVKPSPTSQPRDYVFIGGLHRSGTSLLAQALAQHPQISAFHNTGVPEDEGQHLQTVFPPALCHGGPGRFAFDPTAHLTEHSPLVQPGLAAKLFHEWHQHWDLGKSLLLEKSPPNLIRTRFLQAMVDNLSNGSAGSDHPPPRATFIIIWRHPLAVAMATKKWCSDPVERLVEHWLHAYQIVNADRPSLRRVITVRYEDLVCDLDAALLPIWNLLGIPKADVELRIDSGSNDRYFHAWRAKAEIDRQRRLTRRFGSTIAHFGYDMPQE